MQVTLAFINKFKSYFTIGIRLVTVDYLMERGRLGLEISCRDRACPVSIIIVKKLPTFSDCRGRPVCLPNVQRGLQTRCLLFYFYHFTFYIRPQVADPCVYPIILRKTSYCPFHGQNIRSLRFEKP